MNQLLAELGFSEKEVKVYLTILQNGRIILADLAKITGINRTTVYAIAKELIKRGVIAEDLGSSPTHLVALPPEELHTIIRREEQSLEGKRLAVNRAIKELTKVTASLKYSIPKITFVNEERLNDYLYKQTPVWNKSLEEREPTWWGFQDPSLIEHYHEWIDWYWQEANPETIDLKLLTSQGDIEAVMKEKNYQRRQIKFWQEAADFTATTWINGDYVVMVMTREHPHYLVEIHDSVLAHNMRQLFKGIWNTLVLSRA